MQSKVSGFASVYACGLAAVCAILLAGSPAGAQEYWNINSGTWDTTSYNWSTTATDASSLQWVSGGTADFCGTGGTVSVSGYNQTVGNITFDGAGYSLDLSATSVLNNSTMLYSTSPGTLTMTGASPTITTNAASATINSILTGTNGLIVAGTGNLTLTAFNTYTGGTTVQSGTLTLNPGGIQGNPNGTGLIRGPLTINPGATVSTLGTWALSNGNNQPSSITINDGTLYSGRGMGPQTITMTGGTISGPGGPIGGSSLAWHTTTGTLNTISCGTLALISAPMEIAQTNLVFNVAQGSVPGGIDLLDSGGFGYFNSMAQSGSNCITKTGAGVFCMAGSSDYTGNTYVNAGTLAVTGQISGSGYSSVNVYVSGSSAAQRRRAQRHGQRWQRLRPGQRGPGARRLLHRRGDLYAPPA